MAYLMSDMAAGSNAAMTLMQNMGAAPLAMDVGKAQAEQVIANTEKTKLANLVAESGIKADQESRTKLQALMQQPDFVSASDSEKQSKIGAVLMEAGKVDEGVKALSASSLTAAREIATQQKQLDTAAQQIGNAYSVISAVPESKVEESFKSLPEEAQKSIINQVGKDNWDRFTPKEKLEATKGLMETAKGRLISQKGALDYERQQLIQETRERIQRARDAAAMERKVAGRDGSERDMRDWNIYERRVEALQKSGKKTAEALDKQVEDAQAAKEKTWLFSGTETDALNKAIDKRDAFKRKQIKEELDLTLSAPKFPGKDTIVENLKQELALYPEHESEETKGKGKVDTSNVDSKTLLPKGGDTSNKQQGAKTSPMPMPKSAAEAIDGKYYNTSAGVLKWDAKTKKFVE